MVLAVYVAFSLAASIQSLVSSPKLYWENGIEYTRYNNYKVFERSFDHLVNHQDIYDYYYEEHWDIYKYTPTFAAVFGVFSVLPDWLGLSLWNLLNALVLLMAIYHLPRLDNYQKGLLALIVLIELMTSMQSEQSNGLLVGLLILAFCSLEKRNYLLAAFCIVFTVFIKLFGVVAFSLFLLYPKKWKLASFSIFWTIVLGAIPLIYLDFTEYKDTLIRYTEILTQDHENSAGYSVLGWLKTWFSLELNKSLLVALGAAIFLIPFVKYKQHKALEFRAFILASILIWVVIFNHMAESPTFIIAFSGVAIWYFFGKRTPLNSALLLLAFVFTCLSPTDIFPKVFRQEVLKPYVVKAVPCIIIWVKVIFDLVSYNLEISAPTESQ